MTATGNGADGLELTLTRLIDAPREKVFKAWVTPEILTEWWCPKPWRVAECELDPRAGGVLRTLMRGPQGESHDMVGVYLEIVPGQKIVFTDAFKPGWVPAKPFMVATVTLEDEGGKTRYTARVLHWSADDRETHEKMGFHEGWGIAAQQLEDIARAL